MSVATFHTFGFSAGTAWCMNAGDMEDYPINLDNYDKITITHRATFRSQSNDFATMVAKLDIKNVKFIKLDHQAFKLEDVKKFENVEEAMIYNNDIKNDDGTAADPADVFKLLKNVKRFVFRHESGSYKKDTAANLVKEPHFAKLEQLVLHKVTPDFDLNAFLSGIKKFHPNIKCDILFKTDAFTADEMEALKHKVCAISPHVFPNCNFGTYNESLQFSNFRIL